MSSEKNLPNNILEKYSKKDPELILQEELYKKFGQRFLDYRKNYNRLLNDDHHKYYLDYPMTVVLELVNRCDLECVMCYQGFRNDSEKFTIDENGLDKIFDDFKKNKLSALMLTASEPLLYKNIEKVLKKAEEAEIMDTFLFTNGSLLNKRNSEMILNSCITRMFVSIDAATEETYNKVRIPVGKKRLQEKRLQILETKIKDFVAMRNSLNKKLPLTRVSFVALEENQHEAEMFKKKWEGIVDSVEIQRETSVKLYDDLEELKKGKKYKDKSKSYNCNKPWGDMAIYSDGKVGPCCNLVGRMSPIGNINDQSIYEIWNGSKMNKIREGFKKNSPNTICKICIDSQKVNI
tara:strand:- start:56 stop:1102 length:1047 start_codon:yes stop_codon:yes gene_type:complete